MVKPFQMQLMAPLFSSASLASQSMGSALNCQPFALHTAWARSRSKPVYWPSLPTKPYGGYSASKPTTNVKSPEEAPEALALAELAEALADEDDALAELEEPDEHPAITNAASANAATRTAANFTFFI